ncbi:hypothetical protein O3W44_21410 [Pantoea sp. LMR881]|uniref:hypothetical protein n=1 Tax=Pantoea sp. LMR881 TaxID=3014336 RepID=UPI0022AF4230|nr:hypothetical protein [Pantoea sp. LMR881]MCZ4061102.1 hypothetical protein [Pantoea sp. LMR881]
MSDKTIEFLYESINDTQATIRAIDVKIGFLFVIVFLPLAAISEITAGAKQLWALNVYYDFALIATTLAWVLSIAFLFSCVKALNKIDKHITGNQPLDIFYSGGVEPIYFLSLMKSKDIRSKLKIEEYISQLPKTDSDLINHLSFEKMKVSLIREFKSCKSRMCTNLILIWLSLGVVLSICLKYGV